MAQAETFSLPDVMSDKISALVRSGFYSSKSDVAKEALRCLFEHKPNLKVAAAAEMYKEGSVSIGRAAEIAEMSTADFKEALAERKEFIKVVSSGERQEKGLKILRQARK